MPLIMQKRNGEAVILCNKRAADIAKLGIICGNGLRAKFSFQYLKAHGATCR